VWSEGGISQRGKELRIGPEKEKKQGGLIRSAFRPANILWITGGITRMCRYSNKNKQQPI